jgi:Flp pilus assembly pilin Flp
MQFTQKSAMEIIMGNVKFFRKSNLLGKQSGQGMTEYIIIVALIAVAAIGVYSYFGQTLRQQTAGMAAEMSGKDSSTAITKAQTASGKAATSAESTKSLGKYGSAAELNEGSGTR